MTDIEVLRIAAIMAVLQIMNDGENEADVGREYGEAWAQDHRRMAVGRSSLLRHRTGKTAWR